MGLAVRLERRSYRVIGLRRARASLISLTFPTELIRYTKEFEFAVRGCLLRGPCICLAACAVFGLEDGICQASVSARVLPGLKETAAETSTAGATSWSRLLTPDTTSLPRIKEAMEERQDGTTIMTPTSIHSGTTITRVMR